MKCTHYTRERERERERKTDQNLYSSFRILFHHFLGSFFTSLIFFPLSQYFIFSLHFTLKESFYFFFFFQFVERKFNQFDENLLPLSITIIMIVVVNCLNILNINENNFMKERERERE